MYEYSAPMRDGISVATKIRIVVGPAGRRSAASCCLRSSMARCTHVAASTSMASTGWWRRWRTWTPTSKSRSTPAGSLASRIGAKACALPGAGCVGPSSASKSLPHVLPKKSASSRARRNGDTRSFCSMSGAIHVTAPRTCTRRASPGPSASSQSSHETPSPHVPSSRHCRFIGKNARTASVMAPVFSSQVPHLAQPPPACHAARTASFVGQRSSTAPRYFQNPARNFRSSETRSVRFAPAASARAFKATLTELPRPRPQKSAETYL
mmetsp:Transcript_26695/g.92130  ORF Transcript_26695/g.92130 Transcript_26695/m.92130 type:complete len:267 (+) Transcript_26695:582-1382(+)